MVGILVAAGLRDAPNYYNCPRFHISLENQRYTNDVLTNALNTRTAVVTPVDASFSIIGEI
jgi:hypothetical protein